MKLTLLLLLLHLICLSSAETRLAVQMRGKPSGFATLSHELQKDGSKVVSLRLELGSGPGKVRLTSEARYDAQGRPLRKFQEAIISGGKLQRQIVATFDAAGANLVLMENEKRTMKSVSLADTAPRATLSEFWFIRDTPKVGQVEEAYQFNLDTLEWELVTTVYRGKKILKIAGRSIPAHEVVSERGGKATTAFVDDQGLPVQIEQGDIKMVKLWPK